MAAAIIGEHIGKSEEKSFVISLPVIPSVVEGAHILAC
jgi:hypothetical protein